jgi:hypothetical protein
MRAVIASVMSRAKAAQALDIAVAVALQQRGIDSSLKDGTAEADARIQII